MADLRLNNKYLKVTNTGGSIAVAAFFKTARCETIQKVETADNIKDIPVKGLPALPAEGEQVEKDRLYNYNGKTIHCIKQHTRTKDDPAVKPDLFINQTVQPIPL